MADQVPPAMMTEKRLAFSRSLGLASAIPFTVAPVEDLSLRELPPAPAATTQTTTMARPQLVGLTINGHEWLVVQVPAGVVREVMGSELLAREKARELAGAEGGSFAVFQPRGISRPVTTVTDELL